MAFLFTGFHPSTTGPSPRSSLLPGAFPARDRPSLGASVEYTQRMIQQHGAAANYAAEPNPAERQAKREAYQQAQLHRSHMIARRCRDIEGVLADLSREPTATPEWTASNRLRNADRWRNFLYYSLVWKYGKGQIEPPFLSQDDRRFFALLGRLAGFYRVFSEDPGVHPRDRALLSAVNSCLRVNVDTPVRELLGLDTEHTEHVRTLSWQWFDIRFLPCDGPTILQANIDGAAERSDSGKTAFDVERDLEMVEVVTLYGHDIARQVLEGAIIDVRYMLGHPRPNFIDLAAGWNRVTMRPREGSGRRGFSRRTAVLSFKEEGVGRREMGLEVEKRERARSRGERAAVATWRTRGTVEEGVFEGPYGDDMIVGSRDVTRGEGNQPKGLKHFRLI